LLTEALGIDAGPLHPALRLPDSAVAGARSLLQDRGWDGRAPLVVLAAGAAYGTAKRWIPSHVAALADSLIAERGATCVLVGSKADQPTMALIHDACRSRGTPLVDVTGATTLDVLAGILVLARVCVSNDSGAMHVAAAVGTPLVALFGPTRERETSPLTSAGGRAEVLTNPVWCRPCMLRECPIDHRCMTGLTPERVRSAVDTMLGAAQ
jgi:heptosyltransferase-2